MPKARFRSISMILVFGCISGVLSSAGNVLSRIIAAVKPTQNRSVPSPLPGVSHLANEGFLLQAGGKKVLIDALIRQGVQGYAVLSPATREALENARSPFDGVDLVLATHRHADHFDAGAVASHLTHNPLALFISTPEAVEKLAAFRGYEHIKDRVVVASPKEGERIIRRHRGVTAQMLNITHGSSHQLHNLGFLVEIDGKKFLHIGDSEADANVFRTYALGNDAIDVSMIPYWYFFSAEWRRAVREHIPARQYVLMHIPPQVDSFDRQISRLGGWTKAWAGVKAEFPNAVYFEKESSISVRE